MTIDLGRGVLLMRPSQSTNPCRWDEYPDEEYDGFPIAVVVDNSGPEKLENTTEFIRDTICPENYEDAVEQSKTYVVMPCLLWDCKLHCWRD